MFDGLNINGSALTAHKVMLDAVSNNFANVNTIAKPDEDTYKRQGVIFENYRDRANKKQGVKVTQIVASDREDKVTYNPEHPYADEKGYVRMADINLVEEMSDMMVAQRGYQLNLTAMNSMREVYEMSLTIGKI